VKRGSLFGACAIILLTGVSSLAVEVDPSLPPYKTVSGVSGNLKSIGSDTLNNLMTLWTEGFRSRYPGIKIAIEGKGSSTAPPALIEGSAQFGPMSREMKSKEIEDFEKKFGYKPSVVRTAIDSLAVFVHRDNPIGCLSLRQLDAIFSKTKKGGFEKNIKTWGDLGLTGEWADKPISIYGRNSASGTYAYFKENALFHGDYKDTVKEQPGSSAVVQAVASDKYAIGYSGVGYKTADVKIVPLSMKEGEKCFEATAQNAYQGDYPLARFLYVYLNKQPNNKIDPLVSEFVKFIFSKEGQTVVVKDGFYPISKVIADEDLEKLGVK
jgi:phosphate transport system substrate-binding protein